MKNVEVYIDPNSTPLTKRSDLNYKRLELFEEDSIQITSSIQNIKDIGSIFTDFSQTFSVPAKSKINNRIFSKWYNFALESSFDPRIKKAALIKIDGIDWKQGWIRLSSARLKNGIATSYELLFLGETVSFKDILGDDKLESLDLSAYTHNYDENDVKQGLESGLWMTSNQNNNETPDIVYPLISYDNFLIYDSSGTTPSEDETNIYTTQNVGDEGLSFTQLKPAIKVRNIFDAIEAKYSDVNATEGGSIDFNFPNSPLFNKYLDEGYLVLHRDRGNLGGGEDPITIELNRNDFNGSNNSAYPSILVSNQDERERTYWIVTYSVNTLNNGIYNLTIKDTQNSDVIRLKDNIQGDNSIQIVCTSDVYGESTHNPYLSISSPNGDLEINSVSIEVVRLTEIFEGFDDDGDGTVVDSTFSGNKTGIVLESKLYVNQQVPEMKIFDFLDSTFKMFNLTAYFEDNVLNIQPLNDYYNAGDVNTYDITEYVNDDDILISTPKPFNEINFKYKDPKTFAINKQNNIFNTTFGDLSYKADVFSGGKLDIKPKFERMLFTRIDDENTGEPTELQTGWVVSEDENPVKTSPMVIFCINTQLSGNTLGFKGFADSLTAYNRPSNVSSTTNGLSLTLNFNAELDEYSLSGDINDNSLYKLFWEEYVTGIYAYSTKYFKGDAYFPSGILRKFNLRDIFVLNGVKFRINEITTNLLSGKSELELVTLFDQEVSEPSLPPDFDPPVFPNGAEIRLIEATFSSLNIEWDEAIDSQSSVKYAVYVDGVLVVDNLTATTYLIEGLDSEKEYDISVLAYDEQGNFAQISNTFATLSFKVELSANLIGSSDISTNIELDRLIKEFSATLQGGSSVGAEGDAVVLYKDIAANLIGVSVITTSVDSDRLYNNISASLVGGSSISSFGDAVILFKDISATLEGESSVNATSDSNVLYLDISATLVGGSDLTAIAEVTVWYKDISATLVGTSKVGSVADANVFIKDISATLTGNSNILGTADTVIYYKDISANLSGTSSVTGAFNADRFVKDLSGQLLGQSDLNGNADVFVFYKDISAGLVGFSSVSGEFNTTVFKKDISAILNGDSRVNSSINSFVFYKDINGQLLGNSDVFAEAESQKFLKNILATLNGNSVISSQGDASKFYEDINASLLGVSSLDAQGEANLATVWVANNVNNNSRPSSSSACKSNVTNDVWYTTDTLISVGKTIYQSQDLNDNVVGGNSWYLFIESGLKAAYQIDNNGLVTNIAPCGL